MSSPRVVVRDLNVDDRAALQALLREVRVFEPNEIRVAEELIDETLAGTTDYVIHVAETADIDDAHRVVGYTCHGHNPVTDAMYDLYWIVVRPDAQCRGVGRALLSRMESAVRGAGGRGIVIETSGRPEYAAARALYERCGYRKAAEVPDFYKPDDAQLVYLKFV